MAQKVRCDDLMKLFRLRGKEFINEFVMLCYSDIHCNQVNLSRQYVRLRDLEKQLAAMQSKREIIEECLCEIGCSKHSCSLSQECEEDASFFEKNVNKAHVNFKMNISRPLLTSHPLSRPCTEKTKHPKAKIKSVFKRSTSQSENSSSPFEADANLKIPKLGHVLTAYPLQLSRPYTTRLKYPSSKIKHVFKKSASQSENSSSPRHVYKKSASQSENSSSPFEVNANFRIHKSRPVQSAYPLQLSRPYTAKLKYSNAKLKPALKNSAKALKSSENKILMNHGEKELVSFLTEEIADQTKLAKTKALPSELDGFKISVDGSEVILAKTLGNQEVEVSFNINHSFDELDEPESDQTNELESPKLKSKPTFDVELKQNKKVLRFTCSYLSVDSTDDDEDIFGIDEVTLYDGEWKETNYAVTGDVLEGNLYDLFMNLLEDKGVTNGFVEKVSDFSTAYEHKCYVSLLENIQKFASNK